MKVRKSGASDLVTTITLLSDEETCVFHLRRFLINADEGHRLTKFLLDLAEKADSLPSDLTRSDQLWILRGALSLLAAETAQDANARSQKLVSLPSPRFNSGTDSSTCIVPLWGYGKDDEKASNVTAEWAIDWNIDLATLTRCQQDDSLNEKHINWLESDASGGAKIKTSDASKAMRIAKQASLRAGAWIGSSRDCMSQAAEACNPNRLTTLRDAVLFYFTKHPESGSVHVAPATWLRNRATKTLSVIMLYGPTNDEIWWVCDAVLQSLNQGLSVEAAWLEGHRMAKVVREMALEELPARPIIPCGHPKDSNALHVCPGCWFMRVCGDFVDSRHHRDPVCKKCDRKGRSSSLMVPMDVRTLLRFAATNVFEEEKEQGRYPWTADDIKVKTDSLLTNLQPFLVDSTTIRDAYIRRDLRRNVRPVHLSADGKRVDPLAISLDAFCRVFPNADGKTSYHHENNIVPCCLAVNYLMRHHEKTLLTAMSNMVLATQDTPEDRLSYESALMLFRECLKNSYEMGSFSSQRQARRVNQPQPANMPAIMNALRNGAPLLPRATHLSKVYRFRSLDWKIDVPASEHLLKVKWPGLDYIMKNITSAAELHGLNTAEYRQLWLRNDAFCPFALDCVLPDDYGNGIVYEIMFIKFERMRNTCDWREVNNPHREQAEMGELMVAIANLWFRMLRNDLDRGIPLGRCGRDELGLIPHPTIRWLLSSSVGHQHHGLPMTLGISGWDPAGGTLCTFDLAKCNIRWETHACNSMKWDFNEKYYPLMFGLLQNVRRQPIPGAEGFALPQPPDKRLEDELWPTLYPDIRTTRAQRATTTMSEALLDDPENDTTEDSEEEQEYAISDDVEPAFATVDQEEEYAVDRGTLTKHSHLLNDAVAEDIGFVQGFTDIRDYGLDDESMKTILDEAKGTTPPRDLQVEEYRAFTEEAILRIGPGNPGRIGFRSALEVLRLYYDSDGSENYATIANQVLEHLNLHESMDVKISPAEEILGTIESALASVETSGESGGRPLLVTPLLQATVVTEPPSRAPKTDDTRKRIVLKDESYLGSPKTGGRKKPLLGKLDLQPIRTASRQFEEAPFTPLMLSYASGSSGPARGNTGKSSGEADKSGQKGDDKKVKELSDDDVE
jgi:hypothetical protein